MADVMDTTSEIELYKDRGFSFGCLPALALADSEGNQQPCVELPYGRLTWQGAERDF